MKAPYKYISEEDKGVYDAMNKGIEHSKGEWLYFLGSDDVLFDSNSISQFFNVEISSNIKVLLAKIKYNGRKEDSFLLRLNKGVKTSKFTNLIWLNNTIHHQAVVYRKSVFLEKKYSLKYKILSDYHFNINLHRNRINYIVKNYIVAVCGTNGISKNYNWKLYQEELKLKVNLTSVLMKPFFFLLVSTKYIIKRLLN